MESLGPEKDRLRFALLESSLPKIDISFPLALARDFNYKFGIALLIKISIGITALL
jgi:hypothetical protein